MQKSQNNSVNQAVRRGCLAMAADFFTVRCLRYCWILLVCLTAGLPIGNTWAGVSYSSSPSVGTKADGSQIWLRLDSLDRDGQVETGQINAKFTIGKMDGTAFSTSSTFRVYTDSGWSTSYPYYAGDYTISFTAIPGYSTPGAYKYQIKHEQSDLYSGTITITIASTNAPPSVSNLNLQSQSDGSLSVLFDVSDPDGDSLGASLEFPGYSSLTKPSLGSGGNRTVTATYTASELRSAFGTSAGSYTIKAVTYDSANATDYKTATYNYSPPAPTNHVPSVSNLNLQSQADGSLSVTFDVSDPDGGSLGASLEFPGYSSLTKPSLGSGGNRTVTATYTASELRSAFGTSAGSYTIKAVAYDSANVTGYKTATYNYSPATPTNSAPTVPAGFNASSSGTNTATLTWNASTDPESDAITYRIQTSLDQTNWGGDLTTSGTSYSLDTSAFAGKTVYIQIRAEDSKGKSSNWAQTQLAVASATATQPSGQSYLLSEDFSSGSLSDWYSAPSSGTKFSVINGELQQTNTGAGLLYHDLAYSKGYNWSDYTLTYKARHVSGFYSVTALYTYIRRQNIALANNADQPGYAVTLHGNGHVYLYVIDAQGTRKELAASTSLIKTPNYTGYSVKISAVGQSIKVWVDDNLMIDATDATYSSGTIALSSAHVVGAFDDVKVVGESAQSDEFTDAEAQAKPEFDGDYEVANGQHQFRIAISPQIGQGKEGAIYVGFRSGNIWYFNVGGQWRLFDGQAKSLLDFAYFKGTLNDTEVMVPVGASFTPIPYGSLWIAYVSGNDIRSYKIFEKAAKTSGGKIAQAKTNEFAASCIFDSSDCFIFNPSKIPNPPIVFDDVASGSKGLAGFFKKKKFGHYEKFDTDKATTASVLAQLSYENEDFITRFKKAANLYDSAIRRNEIDVAFFGDTTTNFFNAIDVLNISGIPNSQILSFESDLRLRHVFLTGRLLNVYNTASTRKVHAEYFVSFRGSTGDMPDFFKSNTWDNLTAECGGVVKSSDKVMGFDWFLDFSNCPRVKTNYWSAPVHAGASLYAEAVIKDGTFQKTINAVENCTAEGKHSCALTLIGHSLGGGVATLIKDYLFSRIEKGELKIAKSQVEVYTYGAPYVFAPITAKPGSAIAVYAGSHQPDGDSHFRIVNTSDPVPAVGTSSKFCNVSRSSACHVGTPFAFEDDAENTVPEFIYTGTKTDESGFYPGSHSMTRYIGICNGFRLFTHSGGEVFSNALPKLYLR